MKKILAAFCAAFVLATGTTAFAYACDGGSCTLPEKEYKASSYSSGAYCDDSAPRRGSCYDR